MKIESLWAICFILDITKWSWRKTSQCPSNCYRWTWRSPTNLTGSDTLWFPATTRKSRERSRLIRGMALCTSLLAQTASVETSTNLKLGWIASNWVEGCPSWFTRLHLSDSLDWVMCCAFNFLSNEFICIYSFDMSNDDALRLFTTSVSTYYSLLPGKLLMFIAFNSQFSFSYDNASAF